MNRPLVPKHRKVPTPRREWLAVIRRANEAGAFDDLLPRDSTAVLPQKDLLARAIEIAGECPDVPPNSGPASFSRVWWSADGARFLRLLVEGC